MAKYIYLRVSTTKQDYTQQLQEIINYGIDPASVDEIVEEKESGGKSYTERKLNDLIAKCQKGDVIYVASTDRVGRCFFDMVKLMMYCSERGITMIACKQRLSLSADDFASKVILNITALFDEDERLRIQRRTKNKKAWQRQQIEEKGYYIVEKGVHKGEPWYWMGNKPGTDTSAARQQSIIAKKQNALRRHQEPQFEWMRMQFLKGKSSRQIMEEFNELHKAQPDVFHIGAKDGTMKIYHPGAIKKRMIKMGLL